MTSIRKRGCDHIKDRAVRRLDDGVVRSAIRTRWCAYANFRAPLDTIV